MTVNNIKTPMILFFLFNILVLAFNFFISQSSDKVNAQPVCEQVLTHLSEGLSTCFQKNASCGLQTDITTGSPAFCFLTRVYQQDSARDDLSSCLLQKRTQDNEWQLDSIANNNNRVACEAQCIK